MRHDLRGAPPAHAVALPAPADVKAARQRIAGVVHCTPLLTSQTIDKIAGRHVIFKAEHLQKTGSYKVRGAANQVLLRLADEDEGPVRGLVASSSGNHGMAVSWLGMQYRLPVVVVVPADIQPHKLDGLHAYDARTVTVQADSQALIAEEARLSEKLGYLDVHPFDHPAGIAGQGTCIYEALGQAAGSSIESVVCPVGGGGLAAGSALAVRAAGSSTAVYGVEPTGADDTARSLVVGRVITLAHVSSIADALLSRRPGTTTFAINAKELAGVVTVPDESISAAVALLHTRTKQVVEPSGAVGLAAVLDGRLPGSGTVLVVLSGGNVAPVKE